MNETLISNEVTVNRLFVEGSDDKHFCHHLFDSYHLDQAKIEVIDGKGVNNILKIVSVEIIGSGDKHLGIIMDADESLHSRWESLRDNLLAWGYTDLPGDPIPEGTIIKEADMPTIGIWIMPDNQISGMLENFVGFLVPTGDNLWTIAETVVDEVMQLDCRFPVQHKIKSLIHTWLAWQKEPGKPIGQAITKRYFDPFAPHSQKFINWTRNVFEI